MLTRKSTAQTASFAWQPISLCVTPIAKPNWPPGIHAQLLQQLQKEILEALATGWPLSRILTLSCQRAEALSPDAICSVLRVDSEANCLLPLAGPNFPDEIQKATEHVPVGPSTGSCGTAAYRGEPVEATDIATDPLLEGL